jgi:hypothetical protein
MDIARGTPRRPTLRQVDYLQAIRALGDHATIDEIAAALEVSPRTARVMIDYFEAAEWVELMRLRRPAWVRITPLGLGALLIRGGQSFADEMRAQGIHVGIGRSSGPVLCVVCEVPYPCAAAGPAPEPPCLADADEPTDRALESVAHG